MLIIVAECDYFNFWEYVAGEMDEEVFEVINLASELEAMEFIEIITDHDESSFVENGKDNDSVHA